MEDIFKILPPQREREQKVWNILWREYKNSFISRKLVFQKGRQSQFLSKLCSFLTLIDATVCLTPLALCSFSHLPMQIFMQAAMIQLNHDSIMVSDLVTVAI